jgi:hypothetical protein
MWTRIPKENSVQPKTGTYPAWKPLLRDEGYARCVYCFISDIDFGGIRNFHVEHYKPKSLFQALENVFLNLFYSCPVCNVFKGDRFPDVPEPFDSAVLFYPDPSVHCYSDFLSLNNATGEIEGQYLLSRFLIEAFHLNRAQLVVQRLIYIRFGELSRIYDACSQMVARLKTTSADNKHAATEFLLRVSSFLVEIGKLRHELDNLSRYDSNKDLR